MSFKIVFFSFAALLAANIVASEKKVICYYGTWATYRPSLGKYDVADVNVDLCTHVIYAFVGINGNGTVISLDPTLDLPSGRDNFAAFTALKTKNANLKTILSVGGWNEGSANYSTMVASATLRKNFITTALEFIQTYSFDGFEIDWEYPARRDTTNGDADIDNFSTLLKEMRAEFDKYGLTLSAAVSAVESAAKLSYDIPTISKYLDWVDVMTYDLHGSWDGVTGYNSGLYAGEGDENADKTSLFTVENAINYWLSAGCPPEKLILGVPFYGKTFTLANATQHGVKASTTGVGIAGPYTQEGGTVGYNEFCVIITEESYNVVYDSLAKVPYAYKDTNWVSFDNAQSIYEKAKFASDKNLGGVMTWSIETDDFNGSCGEKYPLLKAINNGLGRVYVSTTTQSSTTVAYSTTTSISVSKSTATVASTTSIPASTTTTSSPTTTSSSTEIPIEPTPDVSSVCQAEGYFSNPEDCSSFIVCVRDAYGDLVAKYFKCPSTLYWDQSIVSCNYPRLVKCNV